MGRYIDEILQPGERVPYSTNEHWMFFLPAIAAWIAAVAFLVLWRLVTADALMLVCLALAAVAGLAALYWTATAWFHRWTTETDVTNMRVVHKTGFIKRRTFEMSLDKVESRRQPEHSWPPYELRRPHHSGRRRGHANHFHHCVAAGVSRCHHDETGWQVVAMQQNYSAGFSATNFSVEPPRSRGVSQLPETSLYGRSSAEGCGGRERGFRRFQASKFNTPALRCETPGLPWPGRRAARAVQATSSQLDLACRYGRAFGRTDLCRLA